MDENISNFTSPGDFSLPDLAGIDGKCLSFVYIVENQGKQMFLYYRYFEAL